MKEKIEAAWQRAVSEPAGLKVQTDDPASLLTLLLVHRQQSADPELFKFTLQVKKDSVWIVRSKGIGEVKTDGDYRPLEE